MRGMQMPGSDAGTLLQIRAAPSLQQISGRAPLVFQLHA